MSAERISVVTDDGELSLTQEEFDSFVKTQIQESSVNLKWASLRLTRNNLLLEADKLVIKYITTDREIPQALKDYMQALRDLPSAVTDIDSASFPQIPVL
jgi:hypothetical protein